MSLLVVGSVGYDTIITPQTTGKDLLGGSATYFSIAAGYYSPVSLIGVVGEDFSTEDEALLVRHGVDISGLERVSGKTFRWTGRYRSEDVNLRDTLDLQLNVFDGFNPVLSAEQRRADYLFLGNTDPAQQLETLAQMESRPKLVAADTISQWIEHRRSYLTEVLKSVDVMFMDEGEVRDYAGEFNLVRAARSILELGPQAVVAKRGEHGVLDASAGLRFRGAGFSAGQRGGPDGSGGLLRRGIHGIPGGDERPERREPASGGGGGYGDGVVHGAGVER